MTCKHGPTRHECRLFRHCQRVARYKKMVVAARPAPRLPRLSKRLINNWSPRCRDVACADVGVMNRERSGVVRPANGAYTRRAPGSDEAIQGGALSRIWRDSRARCARFRQYDPEEVGPPREATTARALVAPRRVEGEAVLLSICAPCGSRLQAAHRAPRRRRQALRACVRRACGLAVLAASDVCDRRISESVVARSSTRTQALNA